MISFLLALEKDCASSWESFNRLMKILGWKLSDDKATDWAQRFEALGVAFGLEHVRVHSGRQHGEKERGAYQPAR